MCVCACYVHCACMRAPRPYYFAIDVVLVARIKLCMADTKIIETKKKKR